MKNLLVLMLLCCITVSCKKVIKIEQVDLKTAKEDVQRFYHTYPDSVGCEPNGKKCKYAVSNVYTVYAVKFTSNANSKNKNFILIYNLVK